MSHWDSWLSHALGSLGGGHCWGILFRLSFSGGLWGVVRPWGPWSPDTLDVPVPSR